MRALVLGVLLALALTPSTLAKEEKPKPTPVRGRVVTRVAAPTPTRAVRPPTPKPAAPPPQRVAPTRVPPTALPPTPEPPPPEPTSPPPEPTSPPPQKPAATPRPGVLQSAAVVIPTPEPTLEPTREPEIIDMASDPNARSQQTRLPTPTPRATATVVPQPTPVPTLSVMDDVVAASFEPMLAGGRIGLAAAGLAGAAALALHLMRRKR